MNTQHLMRHLKGKAVGNTVVLEEALVAVDVVVHEAGDHEEFVFSQEMHGELDAAAESIRKGKAVDMDDVLARLEQIEVRQTVNRVEAVSLIVADLAVKLSARERADALLNAWSVCETDAEFLALPEDLRTRMVGRDEPDAPDDRLYDPLVALSLRWQFRGVLNSYLQERLTTMGITITVEGPIEPMVACPCCDFFSLEARNELEICRVCLWEDTGDDPEMYSGPNHVTLREGRANFVEHGVCEPRLRAPTELDLARRYRR